MSKNNTISFVLAQTALNKISVNYRLYETEKDLATKGFISVVKYDNDNKVVEAFNDLKLVFGKQGYFIAEPSGQKYTDKNGEIKYSVVYILNQNFKAAILKGLLKQLETVKKETKKDDAEVVEPWNIDI